MAIIATTAAMTHPVMVSFFIDCALRARWLHFVRCRFEFVLDARSHPIVLGAGKAPPTCRAPSRNGVAVTTVGDVAAQRTRRQTERGIVPSPVALAGISYESS